MTTQVRSGFSYATGEDPQEYDRVRRVDPEAAIGGHYDGEVATILSDGRVYVRWRGTFRDGEPMKTRRGFRGRAMDPKRLQLVRRADPPARRGE